MNDADVLTRLSDIGLELPDITPPIAAYLPCVVAGSLAFVAGQVPMVDGVVVSPGHLGDSVSVEEGTAAAERAALQALGVLRGTLGSFDRLVRLVQVGVFVASTPAFTDHPKVGNGASELLLAALGEPGRHARAAVGVPSLPLGSCVEVTVIAEIRPG